MTNTVNESVRELQKSRADALRRLATEADVLANAMLTDYLQESMSDEQRVDLHSVLLKTQAAVNRLTEAAARAEETRQ